MKKKFLALVLSFSILISNGIMPVAFATENNTQVEQSTADVTNELSEVITEVNTFNLTQNADIKTLDESVTKVETSITDTYSKLANVDVTLEETSEEIENVELSSFIKGLDDILTTGEPVLETFYNTNTSNFTAEELNAFNNSKKILSDNAIDFKTITIPDSLEGYMELLNTFNASKNNSSNKDDILSLGELNEKIINIQNDILKLCNKIYTDTERLGGFSEEILTIMAESETTLNTFNNIDVSDLSTEELNAYNNIKTILFGIKQDATVLLNTASAMSNSSGGYSGGSLGSGSGIVDYRALARCGNSATEDGFAETSDGVNRRPLSVKNIDYYTTLEEQCSTKGLTEIELNSKDGRSLSYSTSKRYTCECGESTLVKTKYTFEDPKLVYSSSDTETNVSLDVSISPKKCSCGNEIPSSSGKSMKLSAFIREHGGYEELNLDGNTYYVKEDMLDELNIDESHRVLFKPSGDTLTLTTFNPTRIDFYYEVERGVVEGHEETAKYGIYPLYNDVQIANTEGGTSYSINRGQLISEKIFFVCGFCAKCTTCDNSVASTGKTLVDTPNDFVLSRYCAEEHACGFFWYIDNGDDFIPSVEGIDCWNYQRADGSVFCIIHKCETCEKPIIGVNLLDSRADSPSVYQGELETYYSNFCVTHFCQSIMCAKERINPSKTQPNKSDGKCHDFPIYCEDHADKCGVCGENSVLISAYESEPMKGKAVCNSCKNSSVKAKVTCSSCGIELSESRCYDYKGLTICYICASKACEDENNPLQVNGVTITWEDLMNQSGVENIFAFLSEIRPNGSIVLGEYIDYKQGKGMPWSSIPYSAGNIGRSGCGPTSVAICATGFGIDIDPGELVSGWNGEKLWASASSNGKLLNSIGLKQTKVSGYSAVDHLRTGKPVILRCTRGYYTRGGHYMAATAVREVNGKIQVYISNPASYYKTGWTDYSVLKRRGVFEFYAVDVK